MKQLGTTPFLANFAMWQIIMSRCSLGFMGLMWTVREASCGMN